MVTPNLPEARALSGLGERATTVELGEALLALGPEAVVVTGGHAADGADVLVDASGSLRIDGPRYPDGAAHGSGCTHSSALAAFLARGEELADAARWAREIASEAVGHGLRELGRGPGPVDVFGHNRGEMKLVRMKSGHGDVLLAEGDPELAEDEERLVAEFRRQLELGMWAAVPTAERGHRRAAIVRDFAEVPRDAERVIFFPRAAGG